MIPITTINPPTPAMTPKTIKNRKSVGIEALVSQRFLVVFPRASL